MAESPDELAQRLRELARPGTRKRLVARGLARGFIWRQGKLPQGAPSFDENLTLDLLNHAFGLLALALRLRETGQHLDVAADTLRVAAEAIESVARRGDPSEPERGFLIVVAAAAFHIARFSARAYCLLGGDLTALNLSSAECVLAFLMRRDLAALRDASRSWLQDPAHGDRLLSVRLADDGDDFDIDDLVAVGLTRDVHRALAFFDAALMSGERDALEAARELMSDTVRLAGEAQLVPIWWIATLALHLMDDLWGSSFHVRLPLLPSTDRSADTWLGTRRSYLALLAARRKAEIDLWPSQLLAAARAIDVEDDLVIALPTSAGKTRIAELCILRALSTKARVVYVTPLRALSAQLERTLGSTFRPLGFNVSSLYGASGVSSADFAALEADHLVVATPEKLDFAIRQNPSVINDVALIVLDEGHMIGLGTREVRYEVLVQRLLARPDAPHRRIACLSAIFSEGDAFDDFTAWLRSDAPGTAIHASWRPTRQRPAVLTLTTDGAARLDLEIEGEKPYIPRFIRPMPPQGGRRTAFPNTSNEMVAAAAKALTTEGQRVLIYCPLRRSVEPLAKLCIKLYRQGVFPGLLDDPTLIARAEFIGEEWLGQNHNAVKALRLGIAVHHGELPRPFLAEIEQLLHNRILKLIIASPTVAQGLDLSCSALILHSLSRGRSRLPPAEFANVIGRAGRAFVDLDGLTVYPIFETGWKRDQKVHAFWELWEDAKSRSMESGIVLLISALLEKIKLHVGGSDKDLLEYVLNQNATWDIPDTEDDNSGGDDDNFEPLLADLDNAILATIERLDCDMDEVADLLDAALKSSLWKRRLQRLPEATRRIQIAAFEGRARWLWKQTRPSQRKGFFSAGVGFRAGNHIHQHLDELMSGLVAANEALIAHDHKVAAAGLAQVARRLFETHPFAVRPQDLPEDWAGILEGWISGVPLQQVIETHGDATVGFVQKGLVFNLVWGIEAVRVYAQAVGNVSADTLSGILPLALTYGLPTFPAILLVQAGLPSRTMALSVTTQLKAEYTTRSDMYNWLREVSSTFEAKALLPLLIQQDIWNTFIDRWSTRETGAWQWTQSTEDVLWETPPPTPGALVRIRYDLATKATQVSTLDYLPLGRLRELSTDGAGHVIARVGVEPNTILLERFQERVRRA
jgi:hypothetical protein